MRDARCIARGKCGDQRCRACPRGITERAETRVTVELERGAKDGQRIVFEEAADESPGARAGDLVLKVRALKHEFFEREQCYHPYESHERRHRLCECCSEPHED